MDELENWSVPGIPEPFHWLGNPASARSDRHDDLSITAPARSDWFVDPGTGETKVDAPALVTPLRLDFMLAARLEVGFTQTFDAGALVLWGDPTLWAKLALEFSPQREAIVVSVVTRGSSDDASAASPAARHAWLRIARLGGAFAFHVSADGTSWRFVRHFTLGGSREIHVGFGAQSPLGDGCTARFSDIAYVEGSLPDLRNGD